MTALDLAKRWEASDPTRCTMPEAMDVNREVGRCLAAIDADSPEQIALLKAEIAKLKGMTRFARMSEADEKSVEYWREMVYLATEERKIAEADRDRLAAENAALVDAVLKHEAAYNDLPSKDPRVRRRTSEAKHATFALVHEVSPRTARIRRIVKIAEKRFERFGCPYGAGKQKFDAKLGCCQGCKEKDMCKAVRGED